MTEPLFVKPVTAENNQNSQVKSYSEDTQDPPYPSQIYEYLDKFIVGQSQAKEALAIAVFQHYRRLNHNRKNNIKSLSALAVESLMGSKKRKFVNDCPVHLQKSNIILTGPSGVGKTYLMQTLARFLDVPIALCDCTSITEAGYRGEDVESVIESLLLNADGNIDRAQQGIVVLDEIDKIAAVPTSWRDVGGKGAQHAFLKLVEGTVVKCGAEAGPLQQEVQVDTSDILFVASGAFTDMTNIIGARLKKEGIKRKDEILTENKKSELVTEAEQSDFIAFGIVPELIGRFPIIVPLQALDKGMLVKVLTEPNSSLLAQMELQFQMDNVELSVAPDALEEIAEMALKRETGARALRSILEKLKVHICPVNGRFNPRLSSRLLSISGFSTQQKSSDDHYLTPLLQC